MRKLFKTLLPPFVGFAVFFISIRYSSVYFTLKIDEMGEGTLQSFMAFYRYLLPLLFTVAVLTQFLIIIPIWDKLFLKSIVTKITAFFILCFICSLFAAGIGYAIWDRPSGTHHLLKVCLFMTTVEVVYWIINLLVLFLLDITSERATKVSDTIE